MRGWGSWTGNDNAHGGKRHAAEQHETKRQTETLQSFNGVTCVLNLNINLTAVERTHDLTPDIDIVIVYIDIVISSLLMTEPPNSPARHSQLSLTPG